MKILRRMLRILGIIISAVTLGLFLLYVFAPRANDSSAASIVHELKELPLPENTEYVDSVSAAAKLVGNGNGMQYFGAILIKSEQSLEELDDYYDNFRKKTDFDCIVEEQIGRKVEFIEHGEITFQTEMLSNERYYIVYTWGNGTLPFSELDIRGH